MNNSAYAQELPPRRTLIFILGGLITGLLLGAMDQTIVATAGSTIISDLGGLSLYAWVFSAYILTQTVSFPVFGKLSDLYGRRRFLLLGLVVFMAGSILSGASQNIDELIVFRAIQGIGSGAFFPIAIAVVGVVFPPALRARVQGIFASVFGISSVVGPSLGSYLVQALSWRWIFYVNIPLGIASIILIRAGLKETRDANAKPNLDWLGISTLATWIVLLMLGFLDGGSTFPWYSWQEFALFAGAAAVFAIFLYLETKAKEPVLPLGLFRIRTVSSASTVGFLRGVAFYAVISYIPLFVIAASGGSVDDGRNVLYGFLIPLIVAAILGGQLSTRRSYREIIVAGTAIMTVGMFLLTSVTFATPEIDLIERLGVMGFGVGLTFPTVVLAIQYSVERRQMGIASSLAQFMANLGGTIGLAILGTIQVNTFASKLSGVLQTVPPQNKAQASAFLGDANLVGRVLASPQTLAQIIQANPQVAALVPTLRDAFGQSVAPLFLGGFAVSVMTVIASLFITGSFKQQVQARMAAASAPPVKEEPKPSFVT